MGLWIQQFFNGESNHIWTQSQKPVQRVFFSTSEQEPPWNLKSLTAPLFAILLKSKPNWIQWDSQSSMQPDNPTLCLPGGTDQRCFPLCNCAVKQLAPIAKGAPTVHGFVPCQEHWWKACTFLPPSPDVSSLAKAGKMMGNVEGPGERVEHRQGRSETGKEDVRQPLCDFLLKSGI